YRCAVCIQILTSTICLPTSVCMRPRSKIGSAASADRLPAIHRPARGRRGLMTIAERLVLKRQRHLKWRVLDPLETVLMLLCGLLLFGFCTTVIFDIITLEIARPWLWLQEVTSTFFIYAIFTGTAVATRRNDHLYLTAVADTLVGTARTVVEIATRLIVLGVGFCFIYFGYLNFLRGFSSFRMPSMTPIASLYAA